MTDVRQKRPTLESTEATQLEEGVSLSGTERSGVSRRDFLKGAGAGAVAVGLVGVRGAPGWAQSPAPSADPLAPSNLANITETWTEPVVWTPNGTEQLTQTVVENVNGWRFSYDGVSPGPTVRMRGDQTLYMRIQNGLSEDAGTSTPGPGPDPNEGYPGPEGAMLATLSGNQKFGPGLNRIPVVPEPDWALGEHMNGVHSAHVTNLHTHGLHVAPGTNDNGTSSDDIFLRIVPAADAARIAQNPELYRHYQESRDEIIDSAANFEFRLGKVMEGLIGPDGKVVQNLPHPPGTYWYHPHSHGATQNQVASGMAGFLIVEGDVDELINDRIAGDSFAAWDQPTGDWNYRERDFFLQRVFVAPTANVGGPSSGPDPDAIKRGGGNGQQVVVNGTPQPGIIVMQPGTIERWRVLNGSVDGGGYMRFAVLDGHFDVDSSNALVKIHYQDGVRSEQAATVADFEPLTHVGVDDTTKAIDKVQLWQLAWDGVTRVVEDAPGTWAYRVKDLATVNGGVEPDFDGQDDCSKAGNMALCYHRPNEVAMADANRVDVFVQAPALAEGEEHKILTVVSLPTQLHGTPESQAKIMAWVEIRGEMVPGGSSYPFEQMLDGLAVNTYEIPVTDQELEISDPAEREARDLDDGTYYRTRVVRYAGWGSASFPLTLVDADFVARNPELEKLSYYSPPPSDSTEYSMPVSSDDTTGVAVTGFKRYPDGDLPTVLLPSRPRTMSIDGEKFYPTSDVNPRMLLNTSEEWALFNQSLDIYSVNPPDSSWTMEQQLEYVANNPELLYYQFDYVDEPPEGAPTSPQPYYGSHRYAYPMTLAQVNAINAKRSAAGGDPWTQKGQFSIATRAVDHPFHIHQNPFWLMRIEVPDENGDLVNILPEARWADVVAIPRNGGRVVFRSRFVDFEGEFVNHCHILLHEDNGMMQRVQIISDPGTTNYEPREVIVDPAAAEVDVNRVYPNPSPADSWVQSMRFIDRNNTGQVYPGDGFVPVAPEPPAE